MTSHLIWVLALAVIGLVESAERMVDLTFTVKEGIPYYPTLQKFRLNVTHNGTKDGHWYQVDSISGSTHIGTHVDAPCHFAKGHWCVSDIPLNHLIAPAVLVDIRSKVGDDRNLFISDLVEWEKKHGRIPDGSVLLVLTGWGRYWSEPSKYLGSKERDPSKLHFPGVSYEASEWLADNRKIVGIGIDTLSLDAGDVLLQKSHITLAAKNVYNLENVANMEDLPPTGIMLYSMPMKIEGASGAPARIVAILGYSESGGPSAISASLSVNAFLLLLLHFR